MNTPTPFTPSKPRDEYRLTFSQFKALVNGVNEAAWGDAFVYVGDNNGTDFPVVEFSMCSGLPASPAGSSAARWYGEHAAIPASIQIQFMTKDQIARYAKTADAGKTQA